MDREEAVAEDEPQTRETAVKDVLSEDGTFANQSTTNELAKGARNNLLASIKRKLSSAGVIDEAPGLTLAAKSTTTFGQKFYQHRRSRSLGEVNFQKELLIPIKTSDDDDGRPTKCLQLSNKNVNTPMLSLDQMKRNLLQEIKVKLKKQTEQKTFECQNNSELNDERRVEEVHLADKLSEEEFRKPATNEQSDRPKDIRPIVTKSGEASENKRVSICSLSSGVELRKRYSPVYERTRKIVRQSSTSINRWSNSHPQVQQPETPETRRRPPILSRVTSKGDLQVEEEDGLETDTAACSLNLSQVGIVDSVSPNKKGPENNRRGTAATTNTADQSIVSSLQSMNSHKATGLPGTPHSPDNTIDGEFFAASTRDNLHMNSSYPRIGQYSAHPSVYVIERDQRVGSGIESSVGSKSEKMDRSTSTLKRGSSFKGLRKNLKKTFSTTMPVMTLEKTEKTPHSNIPMIVVCCIETLRSKGFLKTEGLYRSSPSQVEVRKVIKYAQKGQYDYVKTVDDPVILAGTLKSFFFTLKHHIISAEIMEKNFPKKCLIEHTSEQECIERLKGVISDLETIHYDTLEYLIKHLQELASYSKYNLMTPSNLGVVWAPCLFTNCDKSMDGADLLSFMGQQTRLMELLITNVDQLFDRYSIDEIMIAIEDGYSPESLMDGEPTLNLRPEYDLMNGGHEFERRKLMRNLSLTFDNVFEDNAPRRNYDLQNSSTVPVMGAQSDSTITRRKNLKQHAIKRDRRCVIS